MMVDEHGRMGAKPNGSWPRLLFLKRRTFRKGPVSEFEPEYRESFHGHVRTIPILTWRTPFGLHLHVAPSPLQDT